MKKTRRWMYLLSALAFTGFCANAQNPIPAKPQSKPILIKGATAYIGNGQVLENASMEVVDGKIKQIAAGGLQINESSYDVIDATGKHLYPGLILPSTTLGIRELDALRQSNDHEETGRLNPNVRSSVAYNTDSEIVPTVRTNGILIAQPTPRGGLVAGTSAIVELDGWDWEHALFKADDALHLYWPPIMMQTGWWAEPGPQIKNPQGEKQRLETAKLFDDALAYSKSKVPGSNLKLESMLGLFDGTKQLFLYANNAREIIESVNFAKSKSVKKIVLVGGEDSWMVTDFLKENAVPVVLTRVFDISARKDDDTDLIFKLPALLHKAGVQFCLGYLGDMEAMGSRNLPFSAGFAVAYGLPKAEALKSITLGTAQILGIADRLGSLEVGKDATFVISDGDLLDMRTNNVTKAFIRGKSLDLTNKQSALYNKYKEKYGLK